jgi:hypothetical protein
MGFDRERNRKLMAMGCHTMLEVLAEPANLARLEDGPRLALRQLRKVDANAPHGWRCAHATCRVRDVCPRV